MPEENLVFHLMRVGGFRLPTRFTYPFHYTPHPLAVRAAEELQAYLASRGDWAEELRGGKMFGVLVVRREDGEVGFLAAFSGMLAGSNRQEYFVPPVYDLQAPGGFFREEEARISALNRRIGELEGAEGYLRARQALEEEERLAAVAVGTMKMQMQRDKMCRDLRRAAGPSAEELERLTRESQHAKAGLRRLRASCEERIASVRAEVEVYRAEINRLKQERRARSAALQRRLFGQFRIGNFRGETKDLFTLFQEAGHEAPPAGAGECAAPRLLQYALSQGWHPVAMAEFWWGESPRGELRRHLHYYPACRSKCEPILRHMLLGLEVEPDPLAVQDDAARPEVLWEDDALVVVGKPAGMLSVPGKGRMPSVASWLEERYDTPGFPLLVHRLDMATSGILIAAKTWEAYLDLQAQFAARSVEKRYVALLDGVVADDEGVIDLPLCLDPADRPRQMVSETYGKPAVTRFRVLAREEGRTRMAFYPVTGRTHQLRVHAAHARGLDAPVLGDSLYGRPADRLYLHAEYVAFRHPVTGKTVRVEYPAEF